MRIKQMNEKLNKLKKKIYKKIIDQKKKITYNYLKNQFEIMYCDKVIKDKFEIILEHKIYEMFHKMYEVDHYYFIIPKMHKMEL